MWNKIGGLSKKKYRMFEKNINSIISLNGRNIRKRSVPIEQQQYSFLSNAEYRRVNIYLAVTWLR